MPSLLKASLLMLLYAVVLIVIGWVTWMVAPPGASSKTALITSGACGLLMIACAIAALMIGSNRRLGMIGIHVGLVLPLLFAIAVAMRMPGAFDKAGAFNQAVRESSTGVIVSKSAPKTEPHPQGYQAVGMASMVSVSVLAFVALLMQRPKVPPRTPPSAPAD